MAVQKKEAVYTAQDGREFESLEAATRHDKLVEARNSLDRAQHAFGRALAETTKTADGQQFEFGLWRRYYRIVPGWNRMPAVESLDAFYGHPGFEFDDRGEMELVEPRYNSDHPRRVRICDLYADRDVAMKALLEAQEEWLAERRAEVEETRTLVNR